jgi:hypothetical protein
MIIVSNTSQNWHRLNGMVLKFWLVGIAHPTVYHDVYQ